MAKQKTINKVGTRLTGPTFCWECNKKLRYVPKTKGNGIGMFHFAHMKSPSGNLVRVHAKCVENATKSGATVG